MPPIKDVLIDVNQGLYVVPEIQRPFVWSNSQVRELFESIYRGYPIGSIIVWGLVPEILENYGDLFRPLSEDLRSRVNNARYVVIDGQQRLTSLWLAIKGRITVIDAWGRERERTINLYYNVSDDGLFVDRARRKYEEDKHVYRVSNVLDYRKFEDLETLVENKGVEDHVQLKKVAKKLENFRRAILDYPLNIYEIPRHVLEYRVDEDNFLEIFEKMSQMFVRLNYTGTKVRMPHLITAILTGKTRRELGSSFKGGMSELFSKLEESGWEDIGEGVLMRTYLVISTGEPRFGRARERLNKLSTQDIMEYLEKLEETLTYTIDTVIREELNIKKPAFFKSGYLTVPIVYYAHVKNNKLAPSDINRVKKWLILASFNRRYTGRLDTDLAEDISELANSKDIASLVKNLQTTEMQEEWLDQPVDREHLTMFSILLRDSYDLKPRTTSRIKDIDGRHIHIHHIFPKSLIQEYYKEYSGIEGMDLETAYNHVANITLISDEANEIIGNRRPHEYLSEIDPEILRSHMIPLAPELWKMNNYPKFLEERKKLILDKVTKLLKCC